MTFAFIVAVIMGIGILVATIWSIRFIATGPPPDPDPEAVLEVDVPYVCTVCGLSLTVTEAQGGDITPPRHCREDMVRV
ncbi:MAG: hypothetical protein ACC683_05715 [Acidimicrobiia bacterium]